MMDISLWGCKTSGVTTHMIRDRQVVVNNGTIMFSRWGLHK